MKRIFFSLPFFLRKNECETANSNTNEKDKKRKREAKATDNIQTKRMKNEHKGKLNRWKDERSGKIPSKAFDEKSHRKCFTLSWLKLLQLKLTQKIHKQVLLLMPKHILPKTQHPIMFMDFLTDSYNQGGEMSMLALHGLFILITKHNLNYPDFYSKLYTLLKPHLFYINHSSFQFFTLLDLFLSSTHLPSYLVGAMMKRLISVGMRVPATGCLMIVALIYNLLLRHPNCQVILAKTPVAFML